MKRYKFPLESLKLLRERKEEAAQQQHAKALGACRTAQEQFDTANIRLAEAREWLALVLAENPAAGKIMSVRAWCAALEIKQREHLKLIEEARRIAEGTLREMTRATRDREALDRYREKSMRVHEYAVRREEQKATDEMATQSSRIGGLLELTGQETFSHA